MRILCVTVVRNEGPYLHEWIAHQRAIGVTDLLVFSNDCEDGTDRMLDGLHRAGVVEHVPQAVAGAQSAQWQALKAAWKHPLRKACDWALVCDIDEFVAVHAGDGTLPALIGAVPETAEGIVLPWRLFGNNGQVAAAEAPVTERFTASMPADCVFPVAATFFKSLIRTDGRFRQFGVHRPRQKPEARAGLPVWVDGSGREMPEAFARAEERLSLFGLPAGRELAECHHYSVKSAEEFLVKRARGLPNRKSKAVDLGYWVERNFNSVENRALARLGPATAAQMRDLKALPGQAALHAAAVDWHRRKVRALLRSEEEHRLFGHLLLTSDSRVVPPKQALEMARLYQDTRRNRDG